MEFTFDIGTYFDVISSYVGQIQTLNTQIGQMEYALVTKDVDNKLLTEENNGLRDKLAIVKENAHTSKLADMERLTIRLAILVNTKDQVTRLNQKNTKLKADVKVLSDQVIDRDNKLSNTIMSHENLTKQIKHLKYELESTETENSRLDLEHTKLRNDLVHSAKNEILKDELTNLKKENLLIDMENTKLKILNDKSIDAENTARIFALIIYSMIVNRNSFNICIDIILSEYGKKKIECTITNLKTKTPAFIKSFKDLYDINFFGKSFTHFSPSSDFAVVSFEPYGLAVFDMLKKLKILDKQMSSNDRSNG